MYQSRTVQKIVYAKFNVHMVRERKKVKNSQGVGLLTISLSEGIPGDEPPVQVPAQVMGRCTQLLQDTGAVGLDMAIGRWPYSVNNRHTQYKKR